MKTVIAKTITDIEGKTYTSVKTDFYVYVSCSNCGKRLLHEITTDTCGDVEICVDSCKC